MDEKVKTLEYRVNAGTWPCATHVDETVGEAGSETYFSINPFRQFQQE
jgi:hypothetical protein